MSLDLAFWGLLLFAVVVGGRDVLAGLPVLREMLFPGDAALPREAHAVPVEEALPPPEPLQPARPEGNEALSHLRRLVPTGSNRPPNGRTTAGIAIVIDDMGVDGALARRAISLPRSVTLSFLPYPDAAPALARLAGNEGHEILVHVPMEPVGTADPGPNALLTTLDAAENLRRLDWDLARLSGFDGINNHEGSRFTADRTALAPVVAALAARHLFFLDSRTTADTQVVGMARSVGMESAGRDVFLDDTDSPEAIDAQLTVTERVAREKGVAIAIGHPRAHTLDALGRWTGEVTSRGFELIPVREAIRLESERDGRETSLSAARR